MKTEPQKNQSHPHNNPTLPSPDPGNATLALFPAGHAPATIETSSQHPASLVDHAPDVPTVAPTVAPSRALIPPALRNRKFRAHSFAANLSPDQRDRLTTWLLSDESIEEIRRKIAAPAPAGFGRNVCETTLRRLRAICNNIDVCAWLNDAMETAQDLLDSDAAADVSPMRESLSLMLYSRAIYAAERQADSIELLRLINTLAKLENLKPSRNRNESRPSITRHVVELNVISKSPGTVQLNAVATSTKTNVSNSQQEQT